MSENATNAMGLEQQIDMTSNNALYQFVGAFVDELARSGVAHACVCPGSRSTPLALLLQRHPAIKVWMHLDERSAAFFALGIAKASREPVAIVATSGTATVNFAPAIVEAYYAHVPLLVLTADRPPELRAVGALQTIDQVQLYGSHVKWFVEMLLPETSEEAIRYARTIACRATATARADRAGPVHLNFPFREPLIPTGKGLPPGGRDGDGHQAGKRRPYITVTQASQKPDAADLADLAADLRAITRGLVVCGPQDDPHFPAAVVRLVQELDFPLLADPLSQVRCGPHYDRCVISNYDAFLRDAEIVQALEPEIILRFGATPVSKPLLLYLQQHASCRQILIEAGDGWHDPALIASDLLHMHPRSLCEALLVALRALTRQKERDTQEFWRERWERWEQQTRTILQDNLEAVTGLCEPRVFSELADILPPGATLFTGNSMPVRDLDTFFPGDKRLVRFLANRGVNGIDGVVSTALGASIVSPGPLVLVIGDLSFYHDLNGLLAVKRHNLQATIVLLHNNGGGIFSFLPQVEETEHFEDLFGTPHGLDFRFAAAMYGLTYQRPTCWEAFRSTVRQALEGPGVTVIEVRTERHANMELHRSLWKTVSQSCKCVSDRKLS